MNTYRSEEKNSSLSSESKPDSFLEQVISSDVRIFIDTCSLLDAGFPLFMEHAIPLLEKYQKRIIVPQVVIGEMTKHLKNADKPERAASAERALTYIYKGWEKKKWFIILREESDTFPDNLFQTLYAQNRMKLHMLFITQDKGLAADLLNSSNSHSVKAHRALVKRITPAGYLNNLRLNLDNGRWVVSGNRTESVSRVLPQHSVSPFNICVKPTDLPDDVIPVSETPGESSTVYAKSPRTGKFAEVQIGKLIASGGEGFVYETDTKFAAKIYRANKVTARRMGKVLLMTTKEMEYPGICFPVIPLFNRHDEFVGYLMKKASGEELRTSVFCPIPRFREKHPDWQRDDLVKLCIAILKKVKYLHGLNITMGDINPGNILVKSPTEVYFVDTDSYQIEDFPCPVGQCCYTAPEIQGKEYSGFLRTMGNENFAIATLLFQILLPGRLPYDHVGGGTQQENIMEMNFPYRKGEKGNKNEPAGLWKFMWSHLPYAVKETFYDTFQKGEAFADETKRLSADDWLKILYRYHELLSDGTLERNDPMSLSIFPTRSKAGADAKWAVCSHCGERFPYYESKGRSTPPTLCQHCADEVVKTVVCEDCGEEFPVSRAEYEYYEEKGYELPKRCPSCREKRKEEYKKRQEAETNRYFGGLQFDQKMPGRSPASAAASVHRPLSGTGQSPAPSAAARAAAGRQPDPKADRKPETAPRRGIFWRLFAGV